MLQELAIDWRPFGRAQSFCCPCGAVAVDFELVASAMMERGLERVSRDRSE